MLQNAPFGARLKRGWIHLKHDGDCALSNLDGLNQGSNDITFGRPISGFQTALDLGSKVLKLTNYQA